MNRIQTLNKRINLQAEIIRNMIVERELLNKRIEQLEAQNELLIKALNEVKDDT